MEFHLFDVWVYPKECYELAFCVFKNMNTNFNKCLFWLGYNKIGGFEFEIFFIRIK